MDILHYGMIIGQGMITCMLVPFVHILEIVLHLIGIHDNDFLNLVTVVILVINTFYTLI